MPVHRAADHPTFELGGNTITSFASRASGADECMLYRADIPAGGGLPPHRHDHQDVFTVAAGSGTVHIDDEATSIGEGDAVVVPVGALHHVVAGSEGVTIVVTMVPGTKLIREDGSVTVPPWVS